MTTPTTPARLIELDPWVRRKENRIPPPADARLVCAYDLFMEIEEFLEVVALQRTAEHDELWLVGPAHPSVDGFLLDYLFETKTRGRVAIAARSGTPEQAAARLFQALVRARKGYAWPARWQAGDLVDRLAFADLVGAVKAALDADRDEAKRNRSPLVDAAERLGLDPQPEGSGPQAWHANCPGTKHRLLIHSGSDTFGCGYCRRKGGVAELEAFVAVRSGRARA